MAKKKQIYLVTLKENHKEIKPPACKMIIIAKIWIATEITATTLNFLGKILCCPPIVNSPKGKPQITKTVIVAITPNNTAPNIESINQYSSFAKYKISVTNSNLFHSIFLQYYSIFLSSFISLTLSSLPMLVLSFLIIISLYNF